MNNNLTEVVFILDRSGSMDALTKDTIGGFNSFIEKQKQEPGEAVLTTVLFDDKYEILHDGKNLAKVEPLTEKEYFARGLTALLDAVGKTINTVGERLSHTKEEDRPAHIIFVITTDGYENASKEFSQVKIKEMIERQTNQYNWQFIFLGANINAEATAKSYGISVSSNYTPTPSGTASLYSTVTNTVSQYRSMGKIDPDWNKDIDNGNIN
jgi:uncharacterized protein YegL